MKIDKRQNVIYKIRSRAIRLADDYSLSPGIFGKVDPTLNLATDWP